MSDKLAVILAAESECRAPGGCRCRVRLTKDSVRGDKHLLRSSIQ